MDGKELKEMRKRAGLSQGELAELLGITQGHLSNMEVGTASITESTAFVAKRVLDNPVVVRKTNPTAEVPAQVRRVPSTGSIELGDMLRELRNNRSLTLAQMSKELNCDFTAITKWEMGIACWDADLVKLCEFFQLNEADRQVLFDVASGLPARPLAALSNGHSPESSVIPQMKVGNMATNGTTFGQVLKELRTTAELTQTELEAKAQLSLGSVSRYESGTKPSNVRVIKLAQGLGLDEAGQQKLLDLANSMTRKSPAKKAVAKKAVAKKAAVKVTADIPAPVLKPTSNLNGLSSALDDLAKLTDEQHLQVIGYIHRLAVGNG